MIKENETYTIYDNNYLENLTLSQTILNPGQSTKGHSHENQEEVYFFTEGEATMIIGDEEFEADQGATFLIPKGKFHRVINRSETKHCLFTCVFEKYDRSGEEAKYKK